jgi:hypothetical protein
MINRPEEIIDLDETSAQIEARLKSEYPSLRTGNENDGYVQLDDEAYEAKIAEWVEAQLVKIETKKAEIAKAQAKAELYERLGITEDEAKLLLS